tara:strand:- start:2866 stop:3573 length:708 start_codon:yes stop_codon:yes gene_type:complete
MGNYAVNADVTGHKINGKTIDLSQFTSSEITAEIAIVEEIIEGICEDIFHAKTETLYFNGNGRTKIFFFPKTKTRLISVTSVKELDLDGSTVLDTFVANDDYKAYPFYLETSRSFSGDSPRRRFGSGGVWPKGQNNIQIVASWGHATTPADIKRATILLTLESLKPGSTQQTPSNIMQTGWNDFQITFKTGGNVVGGHNTGFVEIDRMLMRHYNDVDLFLTSSTEREDYEDKYEG